MRSRHAWEQRRDVAGGVQQSGRRDQIRAGAPPDRKEHDAEDCEAEQQQVANRVEEVGSDPSRTATGGALNCVKSRCDHRGSGRQTGHHTVEEVGGGEPRTSRCMSIITPTYASGKNNAHR